MNSIKIISMLFLALLGSIFAGVLGVNPLLGAAAMQLMQFIPMPVGILGINAITSNVLKQERGNYDQQMLEMHNKAKQENRFFTANERKKYDELKEKRDELTPKIKEIEERESLEAAEATRHFAADRIESGKTEMKSEKKPYTAEYRDVNTNKTIRAFSRGDNFLYGLTPEQRQIRPEMVLYAAVMGKQPEGMTDTEKRAYISTSSGAELNQLVLPHIYNAIAEKMLVTRLGGSIIELDANKVSIAKVTTNPSVAIKTEAESWSEDEDTALDSVSFTPFNAGLIVSVSKEMVQDCNGLPEALYKAFTDAISDHITDMFLNGAGSTEPTGLINLTGVNSVSAGALSDYEKLISGYVAVLEKAGQPTSMVLAPREFGVLENLKASADGNYLAPPECIKNLQKVVTNHIPTNLGSGTNESYALIGGTFKNNCLVGFRQNIEITATDQFKFAEDRVSYKATVRYDIQTLYPELIAKLTGIVPAT